ncbi:MAG TPA: undecaprenyl-diphosphate phosphatase [Solirubrobacteraceae bacterium]|jgi:undecaprenyl-diphosphatase|nr:undecaprenyl-diphosphate phosphatase [Solirubrobacteraceae bacterium]
MLPAERALPLRHAVALGLLQGPAELLPISSSAHTTLLPWLAGWPYARQGGAQRKSFEVALHAGAALALGGSARKTLERPRGGSRLARALALTPPALAGLVLRGQIERRMGGPRSIAGGLAAGAVAMLLADRPRQSAGRDFVQAGPRDGLALGFAQAAALAPGVSRNGATLAVARARGFDRSAAHELSWWAGLPVLFGASALESARIATGKGRSIDSTLLAGGAAACLSTALSARVGGRGLARLPLAPFAAYRLALAALVVVRLRRAQ